MLWTLKLTPFFKTPLSNFHLVSVIKWLLFCVIIQIDTLFNSCKQDTQYPQATAFWIWCYSSKSISVTCYLWMLFDLPWCCILLMPTSWWCLCADHKFFVVLWWFLFVLEGIIPIKMIILKYVVATRQYMRFHLSKENPAEWISVGFPYSLFYLSVVRLCFFFSEYFLFM